MTITHIHMIGLALFCWCCGAFSGYYWRGIVDRSRALWEMTDAEKAQIQANLERRGGK